MSNQEGEWNQKYTFCIPCIADILGFSQFNANSQKCLPANVFSLQIIIAPIVPQHRINAPCYASIYCGNFFGRLSAITIPSPTANGSSELGQKI